MMNKTVAYVLILMMLVSVFVPVRTSEAKKTYKEGKVAWLTGTLKRQTDGKVYIKFKKTIKVKSFKKKYKTKKAFVSLVYSNYFKKHQNKKVTIKARVVVGLDKSIWLYQK